MADYLEELQSYGRDYSGPTQGSAYGNGIDRIDSVIRGPSRLRNGRRLVSATAGAVGRQGIGSEQ